MWLLYFKIIAKCMVSFDYYYNHVLLFHWNRLGIFSEYQKHVGIFEEKLEDKLFNLIEVW